MKKKSIATKNQDQQWIEAMLQRIRKAQERAREHLTPRTDLVQEFLAERRKAAKEE